MHDGFSVEPGLTLKIRHVGPDIRIQGIDDHLPVRRAGDFDPAVDQTGRRRCALPGVILADVLGLGKEVGQLAIINSSLAVDPTLQQGFPGRVEGAVQDGEEGTGFLGEDLAGVNVDVTEDGNIPQMVLDLGHGV